MKKFQKLLMSFMVIVAITFLLSATNHESSASSTTDDSFTCMTVDPNSIEFGLRGEPDEQFLTVTNSGTWGAYVSAGWIKINGGSTISSGGNATVSVTWASPVPPGRAFFCGGTITTGTITFYGCSNITIEVRYVVCPCC